MEKRLSFRDKVISAAFAATLAGSSIATPAIAYASDSVKDTDVKEEPAKKTETTKEVSSKETVTKNDTKVDKTVETKEETKITIDQKKLDSLVKECNSFLDTVKVSNDGKDVLKSEKWISFEDNNNLSNMIALVDSRTYATQEEVDNDHKLLLTLKNGIVSHDGLKEVKEETKKDESSDVKKEDTIKKDDTKSDEKQDNKKDNSSSDNKVVEKEETSTVVVPEQNKVEYIEETVPQVQEEKEAIAEDTSTGRTSGNSSSAVRHYQDLTTEKFISSISEEARQMGQEKDLYASVMIAQAILESGSGSSELSQAPNNNLFGIKGVWKDKEGKEYSVNYSTKEDDGTGSLYTTRSDFRAYPTTKESLEDYADLLTDSMAEYYSGAWKTNAKDYKEACEFLQGRYATSTTYAESLISLIETYDLTRFDEKLDYEIQGTKKATEDEMTEYLESDEIKDKTQEEKDVIKAKGEVPLDMNDYANIQAIATSYLGTDYVWGGNNPETGFDCSGLVQYVYKEAIGYDLSRTTYTQCNEGEQVDFKDLQMGDLLFFEDNGDVHHVALYLGDGNYIHSPEPGDTVKITSMDEYEPTFAVRIADFKQVEKSEED